MPFGNEIGLRMLIGGAVREAALLGYHVTPLFSYYSFHGPVFRVLLREDRNYGFVTFCHLCGHSDTVRCDELGMMGCHCSDTKASSSLGGSGPMWLGPLQDGSYVNEMLGLAKEWGWLSDDTGMDLEKLVSIMIEESDPRLPTRIFQDG